MASCLGMYIENNIIKYAKVSKDRSGTKVESFGIKFYEKLGQGIKQIVEETYSYKTPISINLSNEMYTYFEMFSLLGKNYLPKAIKTEFDSYCVDKGYNPNVFETRYAVVDDLQDKDKVKVINISANRIELNRNTQEFESYRVSNITPLSMCITNLIDFKPKQNALIVNMEEKTTITTVIDQNIYQIDELDEGSGDVLSKIDRKENSLSKSYEACKNTTIYTAEGQDLGEEQNYLEDIMPTLYNIVGQVKKTINESLAAIKTVYITGTLATINNVDLYFQEYLPEASCKILKPYFIRSNIKGISVKDYIEVNSAISLALQGLGEGVTGMNFQKQGFLDKLPAWMKLDAGGASDVSGKRPAGKKNWLTIDFGEKLSPIEKRLISGAVTLVILILIYGTFSTLLGIQIKNKEQEVDNLIADTEEQIKLAQTDKGTIDTRANEYKNMVQALENLNDRVSDANQSRNMIPNLLNQIMFVVPENVQITSIENTTDRHIVIVAQAEKYEQLGYFKAKLKTDGILNNVVSDSGVNDGSAVKVTIEGDIL